MPGAARVGDPTVHGGTVVGPGVATVMIGGRPALRASDACACGASVAVGCATVVIA